jgi:flagellar motor switch/type III secretory pathway protein FliN
MKEENQAQAEGVLKSIGEAPVEISVVLLQQKVAVKDLRNQTAGSVFVFDVPADAHAYVTLNGQKFASGKVVQVDGSYGIEIDSIHQ